MECKLYQTYDIHKHFVYIGEIVSTFCDEQVLKDDAPNLNRINPVLFSFYDKNYWSIGENIAKAWNAGKDWKKSN